MAGQVTHLHIQTGPGGWLKAFWRRDSGADNVIYAQYRVPKTKREGWALVALAPSKDSYPRWLSDALLRDVPTGRIDRAVTASTVFQDGLRADVDQRVDPRELDSVFRKSYEEGEPIVLERPKRRALTDDFYRQVALAYRRAVARGRNPGKSLADDSGVPHGTVARWIAESRRRGHLPPAEKGKVTT